MQSKNVIEGGKRFVKATPDQVKQIGEGEIDLPELKTVWWLDSARPIEDKPGYIAVECYADKDPNDFVKCENMRILFNDQAEYYFVCRDCYSIYSSMQWAGGTRSSGWRERSQKRLEKHEQTKGWCEFCDPIFGNGGWYL